MDYIHVITFSVTVTNMFVSSLKFYKQSYDNNMLGLLNKVTHWGCRWCYDCYDKTRMSFCTFNGAFMWISSKAEVWLRRSVKRHEPCDPVNHHFCHSIDKLTVFISIIIIIIIISYVTLSSLLVYMDFVHAYEMTTFESVTFIQLIVINVSLLWIGLCHWGTSTS